jgi:single-strand DNA-binding protein
MPNLNRIFLMGRLTRDPALSSTKSGRQVCRICLAVNRHYTGEDGSQKEESEFLNVSIFGHLGDRCATELKKGGPVYVDGRLHIESWPDKHTGAKRTAPVIYAENVVNLDGRSFQDTPASTVPFGPPASRGTQPPPQDSQVFDPPEEYF